MGIVDSLGLPILSLVRERSEHLGPLKIVLRREVVSSLGRVLDQRSCMKSFWSEL